MYSTRLSRACRPDVTRSLLLMSSHAPRKLSMNLDWSVVMHTVQNGSGCPGICWASSAAPNPTSHVDGYSSSLHGHQPQLPPKQRIRNRKEITDPMEGWNKAKRWIQCCLAISVSCCIDPTLCIYTCFGGALFH